MFRKKWFIGLICLALLLVMVSAGLVMAQEEALTPQEQLGKFLYFDTNLSDGWSIAEAGEKVDRKGQSCASCHTPEVGFDDPDDDLPVSEGVILGRFGGRNSPISAYAMYSPIFDPVEMIGGQFWDGRATGGVLGDPLADQAVGPFLNDVEMANPDKETVLADIIDSDYADLFVEQCGDPSNVEAAYNCVGMSIAAFERTALFGQFSSKYDFYLQACLQAEGTMENCAQGIGSVAEQVGTKIFTNKEWAGMQLFMGEKAMCSACHIVDWTDPAELDNPVVVPSWATEWADGMVPPMFTDFTYDNLGVPQNTKYPLDPNASPDLGLGGPDSLNDPNEKGKFKVMTLRNIGLSAPYAHNGYFQNLNQITHFYNTRDVLGALKNGQDWPAPEYPDTVNDSELGDLGLSDKEENAIINFMRTLSDGWTP